MSTFNELIDFTRSTTGTYLDSVVYGDELVTNGGFSNGTAGWISNTGNSAGGVPTISVNGNGQLQISSQTDDYGGANTEVNLTTGKRYTLSLDVISCNSINQTRVGTFNEAGSVSSTNIAYPLVLGSNSVTFTAAANANYLYIGGRNDVNSLVIDNISVKEVIGGQVSAGTPLLRTAAINEPRLEYDASGNPLGLLIEEARTNLIASSLFNTGYTNQSVTRVLNQSGAPDGTSTATKVLETGGTAFHRTFALMYFSSGSTYTQSVYAKSIGGRALQFTLGGAAFGAIHVNFDLENGAVGSNVGYISASITDAGNGWYRCVATAYVYGSLNYNTDSSIVSVTSPTSGRLESFTGDTSKGLLVFGHQVEQGAFPTSYIPTSGSNVTRAADVASLPVERFAYNQSKGSVVATGSAISTAGAGKDMVNLNDGTNSNYIQLNKTAYTDQTRARFLVSTGNTTQAQIYSEDGSVSAGSVNKHAGAFQKNNFAFVFDGSLSGVDTSGEVPPVTTVTLGALATSQQQLNGHIKSIQYYPKRLSNTELQLLTQPSASPTMNLTFDGQATSTLVEGLHD